MSEIAANERNSKREEDRPCWSECRFVKSCWGVCINYSILILILKYNKPSVLAIGLESDAVWEQEWGNNAIIISSQEHFLNLQQRWIMKMPLPNRSIHSLNSREMCRRSRVPDGNLNSPLNKGLFRLRVCAANVDMNLHVMGNHISGFNILCLSVCFYSMCVFVCMRHC